MMVMTTTNITDNDVHDNQIDIQPPDGDNILFGFGRRLLHADDYLHTILVHHRHNHHHHRRHHHCHHVNNDGGEEDK